MPALSKREWRACLIAPLAAPVSYWLGHLLLEFARTVGGTSGRQFPGVGELARTLALILTFGAPVAYAAALLVGLPVYLMLRVRSASPTYRPAGDWRAAAMVAIAGILGAAVATLLGPQLRGEVFSVPMPAWAGALMGLVSGAVFVQLANAPARSRGKKPG